MYRIIIERKAAKEIENLPNDVIQRIADVIKSLGHNPRPHNSKKLTGEVGWRVRVGDYRILYTIDDSQKLITIYRVRLRKEAYR